MSPHRFDLKFSIEYFTQNALLVLQVQPAFISRTVHTTSRVHTFREFVKK